MLNFQIGKKYRRRDGVIATCISDKDFGIYKFDIGETYKPCYFPNGSQWNRHALTGHSSDIIEEVKDNEMKIEVGKYYKTRGGKKAFVSFDYRSRNGFAVHGYIIDEDYDDTISWHSDGVHYKHEETEYDLIEEWKEPKSGVRYVNVYEGNGQVWVGANGDSRDEVDKWASQKAARDIKRIACVRVEWKEGQFDE